MRLIGVSRDHQQCLKDTEGKQNKQKHPLKKARLFEVDFNETIAPLKRNGRVACEREDKLKIIQSESRSIR